MSQPGSDKGDKNEVLLGIKYEAARLGGVGGDALAAIGDQARDEIGPGWESDAGFVAGREAVRAEHGLGRLDGVEPPEPATGRRPWYERFKGLLDHRGG